MTQHHNTSTHTLHCCTIVVVLCSTAWVCHGAPTTVISSMDDFVTWHIETFNTASGGIVVGDVVLETDLLFNETTSALAPLGHEHSKAFSGVFDGNGHTIHNLTVNNTGLSVVGLFRLLNNATVKNLVIAESCSFVSATNVGSLSGSAKGWIVVENVTNNAQVVGTNNVGGLIGGVDEGSNTVEMNNCVNNGNVSCCGSSCYVGGFVGNNHCDITNINNSTNNGHITGSCSGCWCDVGGFVGFNEHNLNIDNTTNTGNIMATSSTSSNSGVFAGGIVGSTQSTTMITSTTNTGNITATGMATTKCAGGIVGSVNLTLVENCVNKGSVVSDGDAFGIAHKVNNATNIVSMGVVNGNTASLALWSECIDECSNVFVVDVVCDGNDDDCVGNGRLIAHNKTDGMFHTTQPPHEQVDELLNKQAVEHNFVLVWSGKLELVNGLVVVVFGAPASRSVVIGAGERMRQAVELIGGDVDMSLFDFVKNGTQQGENDVVSMDEQVWIDTFVLLCHNVTLVGDVEGVWFVEDGHSVSSNEVLCGLVEERESKQQVWHNASTTHEVVDGDTLVFADLVVQVSSIPQQPSSSSSSSSTVKQTSTSSSSRKQQGHDVVIEFEGALSKENVSETIKVDIFDLTGVEVVDVVIETDEHGMVTRVVVSFADESTAQTVADAINKLNKGEGCTAGVLCRVSVAFVDQGNSEPSDACVATIWSVLSAMTAAALLHAHNMVFE